MKNVRAYVFMPRTYILMYGLTPQILGLAPYGSTFQSIFCTPHLETHPKIFLKTLKNTMRFVFNLCFKSVFSTLRIEIRPKMFLNLLKNTMRF